MAISILGAESAQTNYANDNGRPAVPIIPGMRSRRVNAAAESVVRDQRRIFDRAIEQLDAMPLGATAAERCGLVAIANAAWGLLPRNSLRLLISDKQLARQQWREAWFRLAIAKAEKDLAWSRWMLAWERSETVFGDHLDQRRLAALENLVKATGTLIEVPALTRNHIKLKRRAARCWISGRPDWQRMLDQDEARLPSKARGKSD